jgi:hypothetical protein
MFLPGLLLPGISRLRNINSSFMHNHGGKFRGLTITGHMEYVLARFLKGVKPSDDKQSLTFLGSTPNIG